MNGLIALLASVEHIALRATVANPALSAAALAESYGGQVAALMQKFQSLEAHSMGGRGHCPHNQFPRFGKR